MGKIKSLMKSENLDPRTKLVLISATYFKGDWADKFEASMTVSNADFYVAPDKIIQVNNPSTRRPERLHGGTFRYP